jgi:uncharacterized protein with HEPN domain
LIDRDADHLCYIAESVDLLDQWRRRGREAFREDQLLQAGVLYRMQTMAESASRLSDDVKGRHTGIDWTGLRGFRNFVAHGYLRDLDMDRTWRYLEEDLDQLGAVAEAELQRKGCD